MDHTQMFIRYSTRNISRFVKNIVIRVAFFPLQVDKIVIHEKYRTTNFARDIALIWLDGEVTFSDYIQPACLWRHHSERAGYGSVVGFGLTNTDRLGDVLHQASMPIVSHLECLEGNRLIFGALLGQHNFCAGNRNGM